MPPQPPQKPAQCLPTEATSPQKHYLESSLAHDDDDDDDDDADDDDDYDADDDDNDDDDQDHDDDDDADDNDDADDDPDEDDANNTSMKKGSLLNLARAVPCMLF